MITSTRGTVRRPGAVPTAALGPASCALLAFLFFFPLVVGCGAGAGAGRDLAPGATSATTDVARPVPAPGASRRGAPRELPGLGPETLATVPPRTRQALVVTGRGRDSSRSTAVLYERTAAGWRAGAAWPAHNALRGWTEHHTTGDLRSPIGVYTLTHAGGLLRDPGTRLPYDRSDGFLIEGTGFAGEPLAGSFDHVIAIDYNRRPGTTPLDPAQPLGAARGGGIWVHVDHGGPTQGCVALREDHMKALLRAVDPARHPVIVMGDAATLGR